jgi:hypothetical protein
MHGTTIKKTQNEILRIFKLLCHIFWCEGFEAKLSLLQMHIGVKKISATLRLATGFSNLTHNQLIGRL